MAHNATSESWFLDLMGALYKHFLTVYPDNEDLASVVTAIVLKELLAEHHASTRRLHQFVA